MRVFAGGGPGEPLEEVFPPESAGTLYMVENGVEREATREEWERVFGPSPTEPSEEARACAQARMDASLRAEGMLPDEPAESADPAAAPSTGDATSGADPALGGPTGDRRGGTDRGGA